MPNITLQRAGELLRSIFEILWDKPEGLGARDVLSRLPNIIELSEYEQTPSAGGAPRYEKMVRIITIPITQAGWIAKDLRGLWRITQDGYEACGRFSNVHDLYQEAIRLYNERRKAIPEYTITLESAQEAAWAQIKKYLSSLNPSELQIMFAELLRAMGYFPSWMAPPEKERGRISLVAHADPLGVKGGRVLAQIVHKGQVVTAEGVRSFASILGANDFGMMVCMGGFTNEAAQELNPSTPQRITTLDAAAFLGLWETHYEKINEEARRLLPLRAVHFLAIR
ncbi:MAG: restriction endonuclease [Chloroflexi bacterium]|nr:restriction endonuclease [Chloroflexota bacterium]